MTIIGPQAPPIPTMLRCEAWFDSVVDPIGYNPLGLYAELFWLPTLGPSATWLHRRLVLHLNLDLLAPFGLDLDDLARAIGVGHKGGRHSPALRAIERLERFGIVAKLDQSDPELLSLLCRVTLAPVTVSQLDRLPVGLRKLHDSKSPTEWRTS